MIMDAALIRKLLISRGVPVNNGATDAEIGSLQEIVRGSIDPTIKKFLKEFNGFIDDGFDGPSFISVWPIEKIVSRFVPSILPYVGFADMGFDAIVYYAHLTDAFSKIIDNNDEVVSNSYSEFWNYIISFK